MYSIFPETLFADQISAFMKAENSDCIYKFPTSTQSWTSWIHLSKIQFNIISPFTPGYLSINFPSVFLTDFYMHISYPKCMLHARLVIFRDSITLRISHEKYKL
jgi:hypothetical protein